jgi:hypothetical protein
MVLLDQQQAATDNEAAIDQWEALIKHIPGQSELRA